MKFIATHFAQHYMAPTLIMKWLWEMAEYRDYMKNKKQKRSESEEKEDKLDKEVYNEDDYYISLESD